MSAGPRSGGGAPRARGDPGTAHERGDDAQEGEDVEDEGGQEPRRRDVVGDPGE